MKNAMSGSVSYPFIIRLNRVDCITLSSVATTGVAVALALHHQTYLATSLLFLAMCADALDGMLARKWGLTRNFGRYLDGFMDVLIYLVSPAVVVYQTGFDGFWGLVLLLVIGAGCVRLAVFNETGNIESESGLRYLGMPVFWSVFIIAAYQLALLVWEPLLCRVLLSLTLVAFAFCMVIRLPFFKFSSLLQILALTLGGAAVFMILAFREQGLQWPVLPWQLVVWLQLPVVIGGSLHMLVVARNWLPMLKIPVCRRVFGVNKTWRGFVVMPLLTGVGAVVLAPLYPRLAPDWIHQVGIAGWLLLGACLGLAYVLAELPNSFVKRLMGAPPGTLPESNRVLFTAFDQLDSALGMSLALGLLGYNWPLCILFLATFPLTAVLVKQVLYKLRLKQTAL